MKENIRDKVLREIEEEKEEYRHGRKERLESGRDIECLDCEGEGIIKINILYPIGTLGCGVNRDGTRSGHDEEVECPRCEGLGQFNPGKDKLMQEIKRLIIKGEER